MYGSLCGNVETVGGKSLHEISKHCSILFQVLPACQTWYDYVWAYFKRLVDVQVEKVKGLRHTVVDGSIVHLQALRSRAGRDMLELPSQYWANVYVIECHVACRSVYTSFSMMQSSPSPNLPRDRSHTINCECFQLHSSSSSLPTHCRMCRDSASHIST